MVFLNTFYSLSYFFFFNDPATTEIYTSFPTRRSSDLIEIAQTIQPFGIIGVRVKRAVRKEQPAAFQQIRVEDRKSTRLNSSHSQISYAVFCLKKKIKIPKDDQRYNRRQKNIIYE